MKYSVGLSGPRSRMFYQVLPENKSEPTFVCTVRKIRVPLSTSNHSSQDGVRSSPARPDTALSSHSVTLMQAACNISTSAVGTQQSWRLSALCSPSQGLDIRSNRPCVHISCKHSHYCSNSHKVIVQSIQTFHNIGMFSISFTGRRQWRQRITLRWIVGKFAWWMGRCI